MIIGIVAVARNLAIGKDGKLPWHYSADLKFFKQTTTGNAILMGGTTFDSIGKALPNRLNLVLSRRKEIADSSVVVVRDKEKALALAKYLAGDLFVIGGASVYREFADSIDKWLVTEVPATIADADVFMPENFLEDFSEIEKMKLDDNLFVKTYRRLK